MLTSLSTHAGNLAFPLLLVGGLFLLSRRSQSGMGGPGGPNNPMAFGKSKAKFSMEPNTGVVFDDVAGVEEAKEDFAEVCVCASVRACLCACVPPLMPLSCICLCSLGCVQAALCPSC